MDVKPTIVIDSREQTPWSFSSDVQTVVSGLPVIFLPTPEIAAQMAERMLTLFAKYVRRDFERLVSASEREVEPNAECSAAVE